MGFCPIFPPPVSVFAGSGIALLYFTLYETKIFIVISLWWCVSTVLALIQNRFLMREFKFVYKSASQVKTSGSWPLKHTSSLAWSSKIAYVSTVELNTPGPLKDTRDFTSHTTTDMKLDFGFNKPWFDYEAIQPFFLGPAKFISYSNLHFITSCALYHQHFQPWYSGLEMFDSVWI